MIKHFILFVLLLLLQQAAITQPSTQELKQKAAAETEVLKKADLLIELAEAYRRSSPDTSFIYAADAVELLKPTGDIERIGKAEIYYCYYYYTKGKAEAGYDVAQKNITLLEKQPSMIALLANFYSTSGLCLMKMNKKKEALDRFYLALQTADKANDNNTQMKAYVNIGWAMMELNRFEEAIKIFNQVLAFIKEKGLPETYNSVIYNNLASCYGQVNKIDSASINAQIAIDKAHKSGDITTEANGLFILGSAQVKKGQLNEALSNYLKAQPLREKIGDPFYIVSDQAEIANLYAKLGRTKEGIATGEKALKTAEKNKIAAKLPMIYNALANNYETANEHVKAIELYKKLNLLKDSMYADANPQALAEMQARYETEKQERLISQQKSKIRMQNFLFVGIAGLALLAGLLIHSQYKRYKVRKEAQLQTEIMKQQELATKAVLQAEENERQRIAKDLHDGVGQMMSAAKMNLSAIESDLQFKNSEQKNSFIKILELLDESCKEVRTVSHIMMPNALIKNNLGLAVREFTDKISSKHLKVHVFTEGLEERLDANTETVLYRVIQECVNNAIKHAGASTLDISLIKDKDGISGTIEDNGKGFDMAATDKDGIGVKNIKSRIDFLKGTVDFDSAPGRGTLVAFHVPV
jgi:two-component system, NarL family, sensor kinase